MIADGPYPSLHIEELGDKRQTEIIEGTRMLAWCKTIAEDLQDVTFFISNKTESNTEDIRCPRDGRPRVLPIPKRLVAKLDVEGSHCVW